MIAFDLIFLRACLAEFLCTTIFIFTICLAGGQAQASAIGTAFVAIAIIYAFGNWSGAHFNPAVTVAAMIGRKIDPIRGCFYIPLQILASILAVGLIYAFYPSGTIELLVLKPQAHLFAAVAMEAFLTFILVFVIYAVAWGPKVIASPTDIEAPEDDEVVAANKARMNFAPLAIGLTLGFLCFLGGSVSGGAFNPARATGPALLTLKLKYLWVYWVGDLTGAIAASLLYIFVFAY